MPERANHPKSPALAPAAVLLAAFIALPVLYVLSAGPVAWLVDRELLSENAGLAYLPLNFVGRNCPPLGNAIRWYIDWCVGA